MPFGAKKRAWAICNKDGERNHLDQKFGKWAEIAEREIKNIVERGCNMENFQIKVIARLNGLGQQASTAYIGIRKLQEGVNEALGQPGKKNESELNQLIFIF